MKKLHRKAIWKFFLAGILFFFCIWYWKMSHEASLQINEVLPTLILDAGHGGEDGGAVSSNGAKESSINLDITICLDQMLGLLGEAPLLLREADISLHDDNAVTLREKKVSDLKNRVASVSAIPTATLISIHQNSYPEAKYQGAQVFYAPTGGSKELAEVVQSALRQFQPDNSRQAKQIPDTVYLMNHIENRAILIECGFLSNPEEEKMLQEKAYQQKIALVLATALTI